MDVSIGQAVAGGVFIAFFLACVMYAGVIIGRKSERDRWIDAAARCMSIDVGRGRRYHVVHPQDMMQYGRAMRFMQSDRPTAAARALTKAQT